MSGAFGGKARYNRSSPSSYKDCVAKIIADYVTPFTARPVRILDVGGTRWGFRANATLPANCELVIVNPEVDTGANFKYVSKIPALENPFDLAMMFGVMMYMDENELIAVFNDIRQRMRGQYTFLVAEPNPLRVYGGFEAIAKSILSATGILPHKLHPYTANQARFLLSKGGFMKFQRRDDLVPKLLGFAIDPMYYVIAASV
jgi:hypothetical protein